MREFKPPTRSPNRKGMLPHRAVTRRAPIRRAVGGSAGPAQTLKSSVNLDVIDAEGAGAEHDVQGAGAGVRAGRIAVHVDQVELDAAGGVRRDFLPEGLAADVAEEDAHAGFRGGGAGLDVV